MVLAPVELSGVDRRRRDSAALTWALGRPLAVDSGSSDRSHYPLEKGAAPNTPAPAADSFLVMRMVLAPVELREVRGRRCSIADFRSALVSLGRSLALDSGCSDRSLYPLAKGPEPNTPAPAICTRRRFLTFFKYG
jgi:hypothetical protein